MSDIVERAQAALDGVTEGSWVVNTEGWAVISSGPDSVFHGYVDTTCDDCGCEVAERAEVAISIEDAEFIAAARTLVPELVAEIERLRAALNAETEIHRIRYLGEQDQISPQQWAQAELHHSRQEQP